MKEYHKVWLSVHPERTEDWLKERMEDGFDIHHMDGDKSNNSPDNLVLIECRDHMRLHGCNFSRLLKEGAEERKRENLRRKIAKGESCYTIRSETGATWKDIGLEVYGSIHKGYAATNSAKAYALYHSLEWPIDVSGHKGAKVVKKVDHVKPFRGKDFT